VRIAPPPVVPWQPAQPMPVAAPKPQPLPFRLPPSGEPPRPLPARPPPSCARRQLSQLRLAWWLPRLRLAASPRRRHLPALSLRGLPQLFSLPRPWPGPHPPRAASPPSRALLLLSVQFHARQPLPPSCLVSGGTPLPLPSTACQPSQESNLRIYRQRQC